MGKVTIFLSSSSIVFNHIFGYFFGQKITFSEKMKLIAGSNAVMKYRSNLKKKASFDPISAMME